MQQELENDIRHHSTFRMTAQGWTEVMPEHAKLADILVDFDGLDALFVLMRQDSEGEYSLLSLVGQASMLPHVSHHGKAHRCRDRDQTS